MESDNPYRAFGLDRSVALPVDRQQRDEMIGVINQFLHEEITAFQFDEMLLEYHQSTDSAVRFVAEAMWYHYDDCDDHLVCFSRAEWGYFQRLLLLLESDAQVATHNTRLWSWTQLVAVASLIGFVAVAMRMGWGEQLLVFAMPFGVVSIALSWLGRKKTNTKPYGPVLYPFATFADLRKVVESVGFRKARYPQQLDRRTIRSAGTSLFWQSYFYLNWLMWSPVVLVIQALPRSESDTRVVIS